MNTIVQSKILTKINKEFQIINFLKSSLKSCSLLRVLQIRTEIFHKIGINLKNI